MVKVHTVMAAFAAVAAPVAADNCKTGLYYCGYNLLSIGAYFMQIDEALERAGICTSHANVDDSLFYCVGGGNGAISHVKVCDKGKCHDGGGGNNDYCEGPASLLRLRDVGPRRSCYALSD
ncbi:hypothetical protein ISF_00574 [Cordyceps fumosorosea ARSEF 2679]|uniref:Uncharacterized protein n=1 Tax=Cordyceps fumosorosea (strain ARSEF 2679) TaxID=1081104 RepID=A0A168ED77_CORFA|nr:hypothetical protein ISF_00574 [Cordyceps fumosorosea ARSEF 2679]OAA73673.1 hypothetical protein ISF_00574 [Cordyceps fumosorosea ARSEF 2679]